MQYQELTFGHAKFEMPIGYMIETEQAVEYIKVSVERPRMEIRMGESSAYIWMVLGH